MTRYFVLCNEGSFLESSYIDDLWPIESMPEGVVELTEESWLDLIANQSTRRVVNGEVVPYVPPPAPVPVPQVATKLGLKRALSEIGRWVEVRTLIESNPEIAEDWSLAVEIKRDDPMFVQFVASGQFTTEEIDDVFRRAIEAVALV